MRATGTFNSHAWVVLLSDLYWSLAGLRRISAPISSRLNVPMSGSPAASGQRRVSTSSNRTRPGQSTKSRNRMPSCFSTGTNGRTGSTLFQ